MKLNMSEITDKYLTEEAVENRKNTPVDVYNKMIIDEFLALSDEERLNHKLFLRYEVEEKISFYPKDDPFDGKLYLFTKNSTESGPYHYVNTFLKNDYESIKETVDQLMIKLKGEVKDEVEKLEQRRHEEFEKYMAELEADVKRCHLEKAMHRRGIGFERRR